MIRRTKLLFPELGEAEKSSQSLLIHSAELAFKKTRNSGQKPDGIDRKVSIQVCYSEEKTVINTDIPWPSYIRDTELSPWRKEGEIDISAYYRRGNNLEYEDMEQQSVHQGLAQRLEKIVYEACQHYAHAREAALARSLSSYISYG